MSTFRPSIRVVGSLNADLTTITPRFPAPGETLTATSFSTNPGGKGANQAVACARLSRQKPDTSSTTYATDNDKSVKVEMIGAVGTNDRYYETLLHPVLEQCGIDTAGIIKIPDTSTGVAVIIVDQSEGGENRILLSTGANHAGMKLGGMTDVLKRAFKEPLPDVLVLQAEIPAESTIEMIRKVKGKGVEVVFNSAPVPPGGLPLDVYEGLGHLIVNEVESELLSADAVDVIPKEFQALIQDTKSKNEKYAAYFHFLGVGNVIITLGSKGVFVSPSTCTGKGEWTPEKSKGQTISAEKVEKIVDTTAAGDTFVGAYSILLARHKGLERQMEESGGKEKAFKLDLYWVAQRACMAAGRCVERKGTMESVPWKDEAWPE